MTFTEVVFIVMAFRILEIFTMGLWERRTFWRECRVCGGRMYMTSAGERVCLECLHPL